MLNTVCRATVAVSSVRSIRPCSVSVDDFWRFSDRRTVGVFFLPASPPNDDTNSVGKKVLIVTLGGAAVKCKQYRNSPRAVELRAYIL